MTPKTPEERALELRWPYGVEAVASAIREAEREARRAAMMECLAAVHDHAQGCLGVVAVGAKGAREVVSRLVEREAIRAKLALEENDGT